MAEAAWAERLFRRSVLKQRKYAEIAAALGPTEGLRCLDLGSDNGVVSLLLRRRGGRWASADLTAEAVGSIRELVQDDVHLFDGVRLPFPDHEFDKVAVVDMLEHVADEAGFVAELARVLRPGGLLVTDNVLWDGEVVPGYIAERQRDAAETAAIAEYNRRISSDPRLLTSIVPLRDGVAISLKRAS